MPRQDRRFDEYDAILNPPKPEGQPASGAKRGMADVVRAVGERGRPLAALGLRLGSGALSLPGGGFGATMSGGGEVLAQMIEQGTTDLSKLKKGRIAVEAGLGAIPFAKTISAGKALMSALKGGGISTAGTIGRKTADALSEGSLEPLKEWSAWDVLPTVLGSGMSAGIGKFTKPGGTAPPPPPSTPPRRLTIEDFLRKGHDPDDIERAALRAEGLAVVDPAHPKAGKDLADSLRAAAVKTGTASDTTTKAVVSGAKTEITQASRNLNTRDKFLDNLAKAADRATAKKAADEFKAWLQEAKNMSAAEKAEAVQMAKDIAARRTLELEAAGAKTTRTASQQVSTIDPKTGLKTTVTDVTKAAKKTDAGGEKRGPKSPSSTVEPPPDGPARIIYDAWIARGVSHENALKNAAAGIAPKAAAVPGKASVRKGKIKGTASQVAAKREEQTATESSQAARNAAAIAEAEKATPARLDPEAIKAGRELEQRLAASQTPTAGRGAIPVAKAATAPPDVDADLLARLRVQDPTTGKVTYTPGVSRPEGVIIQPKEGGGYLRSEFDAQGLRIKDTGVPAPKPGAKSVEPYTPEELAKIRADLPNIKDPQIREMALRALGEAPPATSAPVPVAATRVPRISQLARKPEVPPLVPTGAPSRPVPQELLDRVANLKNRQELLERSRALSPEQKALQQAALSKEADDIQKALAIAEAPEGLLERAAPSRLQQELEAKIEAAKAQTKSAPQPPKKGGPKGGDKGGGPGLLGTLGAGPGAGFMASAARHPEFASQLIGTAAGAGLGAAASDEDKIGGAALGGLTGLLGSRAINKLRNSQAMQGNDAGLSAIDRLINYQRGALLAHPFNLGINFAAPTGSSTLASLEKILAGGIERTGLAGPITENLELGTRGLKAVLDLRRALRIKEDLQDARKLISEVERSDLAQGGRAPSLWDKIVRTPADILTTGDIGVRRALQDVGWTEAMSRIATVTSNPRYKWLGQWIANIGKQGAGRFLLPFSRTAANVVEGSIERTPILGVLMHMTQKDSALKASVAEIAAQQGMGGLVSVAAYLLGSNIDPEDSRELKWPLLITNLSGQYGALAGAAFAAGQMSQRRDELGPKMRAAGASMSQDMPLPTTQPVSDIWNALAAYTEGEPPNPNAESIPERWMPGMLTPRFLRDEALERLPGGNPFSDYDGILGL